MIRIKRLTPIAAALFLCACPADPPPTGSSDADASGDTAVHDTSTDDTMPEDTRTTDTSTPDDTTDDTTTPDTSPTDTGAGTDTAEPTDTSTPDTSDTRDTADTRPSGPCDNAVSSKSDLLQRLNNASSGETICIADGATIDLTGETKIAIPAGVTLMGRRETTGQGPLLYTDTFDTMPLFLVEGDGVRVTGIRLRGPDPKQRGDAYAKPNSRGISAHGASDLEIDHSELFHWSHAAIYLRNTSSVDIHHNDFHHNQRSGLGYGVVLYKGATATITHNLFDYNRHAIAGSGDPGQGYTARRNIALGHANGHIFDMHGEDENTNNGSEYAGHEIRIEHNTLVADHVYSVVIRGRPKKGAWVNDNCFGRGSRDSAILQRFFTGNLHVSNNDYGVTADYDCTSKRGWWVSPGGVGFRKRYASSSTRLDDLGFGDFDGDGQTDVFTIDGNADWQLSSGADSSWSTINSGASKMSNLGFADFDGDGKTDVFRATGSEWQVSWSGTSRWKPLNTSSVGRAGLAFGDFDGDGQADVFRANGSEWNVSYGGTQSWSTLASSGTSLDDLAFGDFDGDGTTDVFRATGSDWQVAYGGTSGWQTLNSSGYGLDSLAFADLNGDGETDVLRPTGSALFVSWSGTSSWTRRATLPYAPGEVAFGDFNGDGADDAFHPTGP